jgi:uncharacterized protein (DUF2267 family)
MASSSAAFVSMVMAAGIPERHLAERVVRATVAVLGERLTVEEAGALRPTLPGELGRILERSEYDSDFAAADFYERVRRRARITPGIARESVDVVLHAIGDTLEADASRRLARALPADLGRQLVPREVGDPPPHAAAPRGRLTTLASGRPGSRHPLSEAAPASGQTHSVAANPNPHAETKLSTSRGLTQERRRRTLAVGHPPEPERPIADTTDDDEDA